MEERNSRQSNGGNSQGQEPEEVGVPLGINAHPKSENHQNGNRGAGVFTWRAGRGAIKR